MKEEEGGVREKEEDRGGGDGKQEVRRDGGEAGTVGTEMETFVKVVPASFITSEIV